MKREYKSDDPLEAKNALNENKPIQEEQPLRRNYYRYFLDVLNPEETKETYKCRMKYLKHRGF